MICESVPIRFANNGEWDRWLHSKENTRLDRRTYFSSLYDHISLFEVLSFLLVLN